MPLETLEESNIRNLVLTAPERKAGFDLDKELDEKTVEDLLHFAELYKSMGQGIGTLAWISVLFANSRRSEQLVENLRTHATRNQLIDDYYKAADAFADIAHPSRLPSTLILKMIYPDSFRALGTESLRLPDQPTMRELTVQVLQKILILGKDGVDPVGYSPRVRLNEGLIELAAMESNINKRTSLLACAALRLLNGEIPSQATESFIKDCEKVLAEDKVRAGRGFELAEDLLGLSILKCKDVVITPNKVEFVWSTKESKETDSPIPEALNF